MKTTPQNRNKIEIDVRNKNEIFYNKKYDDSPEYERFTGDKKFAVNNIRPLNKERNTANPNEYMIMKTFESISKERGDMTDMDNSKKILIEDINSKSIDHGDRDRRNLRGLNSNTYDNRKSN